MDSLLWAAGGTGFTFLMTALGAALVFLIKGGISVRAQRLTLGFAGGVMSAAAVFSLLVPAIEALEMERSLVWPVIAGGFLLGAAAIALLDAALRRVRTLQAAGDDVRRRALLFAAVTLHNIPEGMAVGLAFAMAGSDAGVAAACVLALGIGVQNLPEGAAIALPLAQGGMHRGRSFLLGAASGVVEPVAGVLVVLLATQLATVMPFLMAFAAGAMMLVTMTEMFPAATGERDGAAMALMGYVLMMALDLALG